MGKNSGPLSIDLSCFRESSHGPKAPVRLLSVWFLLSVDLPIWRQGAGQGPAE